MSDWKHVPATSTNAFAVANLENGMLRIAYGESLDKDETTYYGALLVDPKAARLLINLLQQALAQGGKSETGGADSEPGKDTIKVVRGSTAVH